jgi:hypothetical protein
MTLIDRPEPATRPSEAFTDIEIVVPDRLSPKTNAPAFLLAANEVPTLELSGQHEVLAGEPRHLQHVATSAAEAADVATRRIAGER